MDADESNPNAAVADTPDTKLPTALLGRVRQRDEQASRELVDWLYPLVAQIVHAHRTRRDDPEDLMQETFMKVFGRLDQYRNDAPFEHWVTRIAHLTCLDRLRRQQVRPELRWADLSEDEQRLLEETVTVAEASDADASTAAALLEKLLAQIPPADAWLLRQVELEGKTVAAVGADTGWNAGVARIRLFRARRRLQRALRQLEHRP